MEVVHSCSRGLSGSHSTQEVTDGIGAAIESITRASARANAGVRSRLSEAK
jgi:hypothetical protein